MKNRIILGATALLAFALITENAQAQSWRGGGWRGNGWRGGSSVYVSTPWASVGYGRGYYGGYYGGYYPGAYAYSYYPSNYGYSYYPSSSYSYYPNSVGYSYYPSYSYSAPAYTYSGDSGIAQASYAPPVNSNQILLHIRVPDASANVWIENTLMTLQGVDRTFVSPPMTGGNAYTYSVRASWMENGKEVSKEKKINVQPGQEYTVSFEASQANQTNNQPERFPTPGQMSGTAGSFENHHEGLIVQAGNGTLVMTDLQGNGRHSHVISADARITRDGREAKVEDLREGDRVRVMAKTDGARTATKIEAESKANSNNYRPPQRDRVP